MKAIKLGLVVLLGVTGCGKAEPPAHVQRVALTQKTNNTFELVPAADQPPYCHVFTTTATGVIWLQTPTQDQMSIDCPAGQTITGAPLRVPKHEGKVKVYVIFSDRRLEAGPLQMQIQEAVQQYKTVTAVDLRAPGKVVVEMIEFTPVEK
ncbi:MAG TPA: hypothetical protein PKA58_25620 [Polyangium sp.]|nr:hypothetical protein [Polyangium sp.]